MKMPKHVLTCTDMCTDNCLFVFNTSELSKSGLFASAIQGYIF